MVKLVLVCGNAKVTVSVNYNLKVQRTRYAFGNGDQGIVKFLNLIDILDLNRYILNVTFKLQF